ncbi:hypothetical protein C8J57DRAFT_1538580 [Mycena rebaudengoi]|nr:hypothetical protein C8J57DRAFT_1538580 [Mycena rebaudengoi]
MARTSPAPPKANNQAAENALDTLVNTRRSSRPPCTSGNADFVVPVLPHLQKIRTPNTFANARQLLLSQRTGGSMDFVVPSSKNQASNMFANARRLPLPRRIGGSMDFVVPVFPHPQKTRPQTRSPIRAGCRFHNAPAVAWTLSSHPQKNQSFIKGPLTRSPTCPGCRFHNAPAVAWTLSSHPQKTRAPNTFANMPRMPLPQRTGGSMDFVIPSSKNQRLGLHQCTPNTFANTRQPPLPRLAGGTVDFVVIASDSRASSMDPTSGSTDFVGTIKTQEVN